MKISSLVPIKTKTKNNSSKPQFETLERLGCPKDSRSRLPAAIFGTLDLGYVPSDGISDANAGSQPDMVECTECKCWFHEVQHFKRGCALCGTCTVERLRRDMLLVSLVNSTATQGTLVQLLRAIADARDVKDVSSDLALIIDSAPDASAWIKELKGWPCILEKCNSEIAAAADLSDARPTPSTMCLEMADKVSVALWNLVPQTTAAAVRTIVIKAHDHRDVSPLSRTLPHAHVSMNIVKT